MTSPLKALIFDVDGTIADTEKHGHLPACNAAFTALDIPIHWSWKDFKELLFFSGGSAQRARKALGEQTSLPAAEIENLVPRFVELKQQFYIERYLPELSLRPGVRNLMKEAVRQGIHLAIVSTSYEDQIHSLLRLHLPEFYDHFSPILGKESGKKTGKAGILYQKCLDHLKVPPEAILVIEDSAVGLQAALRAGVSCAVFYNDYTFGQCFAGASLVARSLAGFTLTQLTTLCLSALPDDE